MDYSLAELEKNGVKSGFSTPGATGGQDVSLDALQKSGITSPIEYSPPTKEFSILDKLAGLTKPVAEVPQLIGSMRQMFGNLIADENNPNKDTLGDRIMRAGLAQKENNKKWVSEHYPDAGNIFEEAYQNIPFLGGAVAIAQLIGHKLAAPVIATGMGVGAFPEAFNELRQRGDIKPVAIAKATAIGLGTSIPALLGFNAFETDAGPALLRTTKFAANAALGGFAQSVTVGAVSTAVGLKEFKGAESLAEIVGQGIHDASVWGILGGAYGAHAALVNERGITKVFKDIGMTDEEARTKTGDLMKQSASGVMDWVENHVNATDEQKARIFIQRPDVMKKIQALQSKITSGERLDPLDYDFLPKEKTPVPGADELHVKIDNLSKVKDDIKILQTALEGNSENKNFNKKIADEGKVIEQNANDAHDKILEDANAEFKDQIEMQKASFLEESRKLESEKRVAVSDLTKDENAQKDTVAAKNKVDEIQQKIDDLQNKHESNLKETQQKFESDKVTLEQNRQADIQNKLSRAPTVVEARKTLENLKTEAEKIKESIATKREELKPKGSQLTQLKRELSSLERGHRKGRQNTLADTKEVQKELSKLIKDKTSGLTQSKDFKKFDTLIRKTLTQEDLAEAIPQMKQMINRLNERAEQMKWRDDLKDLKITKLPVPYQDALKPLLDSLDLHFRTGKDLKVKEETLKFFKEKMSEGSPNGQLDYGEQMALDAAQKKSISEMSHEEFSALYQAIMSTVVEGKRINELVAQRDESDFRVVRDQGIDRMVNMTGKDTFNIEKNTAKLAAQKANRNLAQKIWSGLKGWDRGQTLNERLLRRAGIQEMFQSVHESFQQMREDNARDIKVITQFFRALSIPEVLTKPLPKEFADKNGKFDNFKDKESLTLNAYLKIYAQSQNEKGLAHLIGDENGEGGSGFSKETIWDIQDWIETEHPEAAKAVQNMFDYFAPGSKAFERLETAVIKDKGHRIAVEENYDPIQRLINVPKADFEWGNRGMYGRGVMNSGFINPRVESSLAFKNFDYLGDIVRHIQDTNAYVNLNGPIRDIQKYIDDPEVKRIANAVHGEELIPTIQKWINDVAFNGHQMDGAVSKLYSNFRQKFAFAQIGFNIMSALKEVTQFAPSAVEVGWGWQSKALVQHVFDIKGTNAFIDSKSLMMKNQAFTQEQVFVEMAQKGGRSLGPPGMDANLRQVGLWMHQEVYRLVSRATWLGAYNRYMSQSEMKGVDIGEADKSAVDYADALTRNTHPVAGDIYTPEAFRSGDLGRTLGMFHTAITRNYNLFASDIEAVKEGNMKPMEAIVKGASRTFFSALILGIINQRRGLQKDELPAYMLDVSLGSDVLYGMFTRAYIDGKFRGLENPAAEALGSVYGVFDSNSTSERRIKNLVESAAAFTGLPFGVIYRELTGRSFAAKPDRR